ncbi:MAG: DEAD/DEAH box helicase [Lachnospiraceae bacterium]|nr:DEAD/DEAH box helicase [Lachnospiraceae bacterium]
MELLKFEEMHLNDEILRAVKDMGFETASPIQSKAIPVVLEGKDIIGQAQTGTGKTASFGIPLLQKVNPELKKLQAIVLCPTRELAIQVADELRKLAKYMHGVKSLPVYGGQDIVSQIRGLKGGTQIVIGTPGRVLDHMRRKTIKLDNISTVVLDEADEMLNMGFREDIETVLSAISDDRQTLLFSATMPKPIMEIAKTYLKKPEVIKVVKKELTVNNIEQKYYVVKNDDKQEAIARLLDVYSPKLSLVFCNTKKQVDELAEELKNRGFFAEGLHGDLKQIQRDRVMGAFRNGSTQILVATDVAARGIDVDDVEAVFNYDVPQDDENYVHRIGRTGRAGRDGRAFTLISGRDIFKLKDIMSYCKTTIERDRIPTRTDVLKIKMDKVIDDMKNTMENDSMDEIITYLSEKLKNEDIVPEKAIASLMKLSIDSISESEEDINYREIKRNTESFDYDRKNRRNDRRDNIGRGHDRQRKGMAKLFINIGKSQNVRPGDILGAITGETSVPGREIGSIDMYDKYTFVEVPVRYVDEIVYSMKKKKIKGKNINIETANGRKHKK